jgi:hypothetical protein
MIDDFLDAYFDQITTSKPAKQPLSQKDDPTTYYVPTPVAFIDYLIPDTTRVSFDSYLLCPQSYFEWLLKHDQRGMHRSLYDRIWYSPLKEENNAIEIMGSPDIQPTCEYP